MDMVRSASFCEEVTLQPIDRYPLDAAIVFSDILTIPDAMGLGLSFTVGEGPRFARPVRTAEAVAKLKPAPMDSLRYVFEAVSACKRGLNNRVPLIGFAGSPFTLACYSVEGSGSDGYPLTKSMLYSAPHVFQQLLDALTATVADYLVEQSRAGADALMIFDSWGGVLSPADYRQYSLAPMRDVIARVQRQVKTPILLFSKGAAGHSLAEMAASSAQAVGLDWTADLAAARALVGQKVALQGNVDPLVVTTSSAAVRAAATRCVAEAGVLPGHIFNLGHGLTPASKPELVGELIATVHAESKRAFSAQKM